MPKAWIELPALDLPADDVDSAPYALIRINRAWKAALLSLVQHADQARFWNSEDRDRIEQQAYTLYRAIRNASGMIGAIVPIATDQPPAGTLLCNGAAHARADYPALYAALHPALRIDADYFNTPDLRGLFILGAGPQNAELSTGGAPDIQLTIDNMPQHTHTAQPHAHTSPPHGHTADYPSLGIDVESLGVPDLLAVGNPPMPSFTSSTAVTINPETVIIDATGGGQAHDNMPPYIALAYVIVAE